MTNRVKAKPMIRAGTAPEEETGTENGRLYAVPALEKGIDVLEFLAVQEHPTTLTGIAQGLGRSPSELFRILSVLQRRGWIVRLKDDSYQLSARLFELAHGFPPSKRLVDVALPVMRSLAHELRQSCHLSVADDGEQLVILNVESPGPAGVFVRPGTRYPLATTPSGRVMLALGHDLLPARTSRRPTPEGAERKVPADLDQRLERIRQRGYEEVAGEWLDAVVDICWPVFDVRGEVAAVLAMPFLAIMQPSHDLRSAARDKIRTAAEEISKSIGAGDYQRWLDRAMKGRTG
jgi:DNA-binding IclR family transcriptional regulator